MVIMRKRWHSTLSCIRYASPGMLISNYKKPLKFGTSRHRLPTVSHIQTTGCLPQIAFKPKERTVNSLNGLDVFKKQQNHGGSSILYYRVPLLIVEARGQYVFDEKGQQYLDLFGNDGHISVGHNHPLLVEAIQQQSTKLFSSSHYYLREEVVQYTEELLTTFPNYLSILYLLNSDSEAIELAILLARLYTKQHDIISLRGSYYGFTHLANSISSMSMYKYGLMPSPGFTHIPSPDFYRSSMNREQTIQRSVKDAVASIRASCSASLAGCLFEPVQSLGGVLSLPYQYIQSLCSMIRSRGGLMIFDGSSTGLGRTGSNFWGFESLNCTPDIVIISKGLGNGLPLTAVITTQDIANALPERHYINLMAGNPLCCAVGSAVLSAMKQNGLEEHIAFIGNYLKTQLLALQKKHHSIIGDIRTNGLVAGVEFVKNTVTKEPAVEETALLHEALKNRGVLLGKGGIYHNVIRLCPPFCVIQEDIDFAIGQLDQAIIQMEENMNANQAIIQHSTLSSQRRLHFSDDIDSTNHELFPPDTFEFNNINIDANDTDDDD